MRAGRRCTAGLIAGIGLTLAAGALMSAHAASAASVKTTVVAGGPGPLLTTRGGWSFTGVSSGPTPAGASFGLNTGDPGIATPCVLSLDDHHGDTLVATGQPLGTCGIDHLDGSFTYSLPVTSGKGTYARLVGRTAYLSGTHSPLIVVPVPGPNDGVSPPAALIASLTVP